MRIDFLLLCLITGSNTCLYKTEQGFTSLKWEEVIYNFNMEAGACFEVLAQIYLFSKIVAIFSLFSKMLPTASINPRDQGNGSLNTRASARHTAGAKRYKYLRRLLHFRHMDFEFAVWQMLYLFTSPQKVYRNFQYRKQTKDQWARDDPAFLVLLSIWLCGE